MTLACCPGPRRYFPWNLILLGIFTGSFACMLGFLSSFYNTKSVLLCFTITALVCLAVTIFSFQTKFDFTSCHGVLFVLLIVLCISGLVLAIVLPFQYVPWLHAVYAVLGAIIFTMASGYDSFRPSIYWKCSREEEWWRWTWAVTVGISALPCTNIFMI
ncbi:protein lifeguard 2-like [Chiloscyllium plagiosum]|uniref:protein lifeguard 2-like n=1 Tax=Chiloscyllium plagiosum TaxID=36176 RepID=UPI001CB7CEC7|nr:protein lifeguard 2-like [Chiloscyllium plagiosum]